MACAPPEPAEAGYATAAAAMTSLAIGVIAAGVTGLALGEAKVARVGLERVQAEAALEGGQLLAAYGVMENTRASRLAWRQAEADDVFEILAESEAQKLGVDALAPEHQGLLRNLGAADPQAVVNWLKAQPKSDEPEPVSAAVPSAVWRACAPSIIAYQGRASEPTLRPPASPDLKGQRPVAGEVWRLKVTFNGWVDDRTVRLTGDTRRPAITILREFHRSPGKEPSCDAFVDAD